MNRADAWERLASQRVAVLATTNRDGTPHLVPFVFAPTGDTTLTSAIDAKPKRSRELRRLGNIRRDPRVTVLAHHYEDDWRRLWWVRAEGRASLTDHPPPAAEAALRSRYPQYTGADLGPWVLIEVDAVSGWEAAA